jgi:FAD/FMN-containing dehydrogenase
VHPLAQVVGGIVAHPFEHAGALLRAFRELPQPDELWVVAGLTHAPDGSGLEMAALVVCHAGTPEQAERDLRPWLEFGTPIMNNVGPLPYPVVNTFFDEAFPPGALNYWKSSFLEDLSDEAIDALAAQFAAAPSPMSSIVMEHFHGAVCRVGISDTAVPHRNPGYNLGIFAEWLEPEATDANIRWARDTYKAMEPYRAQLRYVNYLDSDDAGDAVRDAYGPNYAQLLDVKQQYDPENIFHLNHNIQPAG